MEKVDWSKAPTWADAVGDYGGLAWLGKNGYCYKGIPNPPCHPYSENSRTPDSFKIIERRPWNGEGLPPVGTVCEFTHSGEGVKGRWIECKILAYGRSSKNVAIATDDELWDEEDGLCVQHHICEMSFRPIRTPEQIAAEEREKIAKQICLDAGSPEMTVGQMAVAYRLYEAGYRKQA